MRIEKNEKPIVTVDDWHKLAPPKAAQMHWADGRSAKETARAWLGSQPSLPAEVQSLLASHPDLASVQVDRAEPEALLRFDGHAGPSNADLLLWASDGAGPVSITIEAKADEEFGRLVSDVLLDALEEVVANPRSGRVTRVMGLAQAICGPTGKGQTRIGDLRYQLLTATAGTLAHASVIGAARAVLVIHEFITPKTSRRLLARNDADLSAYVQRLSAGAITEVESGRLYGPYAVPGEPLFERPVSFYVGKATRFLGEPSA